MNTPFFSVIVVSRNAGDKLQKTVASILQQTFGDLEILIKDAGSTDGSLETVPADPRIRLICRKDAGIYDGMNEALACAQGEFIYFLNCGDILHDEKVLSAVHEAALPHAGERAILYGDVMERRTGQRVAANPKMTHFAMYRYLPCHQACFYTRNLFAARAFDTRYRVRADYEHFLYAVLREGAGTYGLPLVIADYEGGGYSETEKGRALSAKEHREITEKYFTRRELFCYRAYLVVSLQPLREKLAGGKHTAAAYDAVKNAVYQIRRGHGSKSQ